MIYSITQIYVLYALKIYVISIISIRINIYSVNLITSARECLYSCHSNCQDLLKRSALFTCANIIYLASCLCHLPKPCLVALPDSRAIQY